MIELRNRLLQGIIVPFFLFLFFTASVAGAVQKDGKVHAFVTIAPQAFFVEKVGGAHVEVGVMVPPGRSPHAFEPSPQQIAKLADADVYFLIGMVFEGQIVSRLGSINPGIKTVDTREGIALKKADHEDAAAHPAGDDAHLHGVYDPHIWLAPKLVKIQAKNIFNALVSIDPQHRSDYEVNLNSFLAELDALDARLRQKLAPIAGRRFYVYHPAFGYFAEAYGLKQVPVEIEGKEPSAKSLAELTDRARAEGVKVIFVEPQFSSKTADNIAAAIGGAVVRIDDLAYDVVKNLDDVSTKIYEATSGGGKR